MIEKLKQILIHDEGEVLHEYKDSEGYSTIGIGRLIDKRKGGKISHEEALYLLDNDIKQVIGECDRAFHWFDDLDETRKIVILSMVFNLGLNGFKKFKRTIAYITMGNYTKAAEEMLDSSWKIQVGKRADRLAEMMKNG